MIDDSNAKFVLIIIEFDVDRGGLTCTSVPQDGSGARLSNGQANLFQDFLVNTGSSGSGTGDKSNCPHVLGVRRDAQCGHGHGNQPASASETVA